MAFTAHDVRHLRICPLCQELGDGRKMLDLAACRAAGVQPPQLPAEGYAHDGCVVKAIGKAVLFLPREQRNKITIGAAGPDLTNRLLERFDQP